MIVRPTLVPAAGGTQSPGHHPGCGSPAATRHLPAHPVHGHHCGGGQGCPQTCAVRSSRACLCCRAKVLHHVIVDVTASGLDMCTLWCARCVGYPLAAAVASRKLKQCPSQAAQWQCGPWLRSCLPGLRVKQPAGSRQLRRPCLRIWRCACVNTYMMQLDMLSRVACLPPSDVSAPEGHTVMS